MRSTPLSRLLDEPEPAKRVTPLDAFKLARTKWLAGERIDVGRIASELGVGRATVFRWVGTRENLYGEICSALFKKELDRAVAGARGSGSDYLVDVMTKLLHSLAAATPLRRFVAEDPEFALRVLTSRHSPVQRRCTIAVKELIDEATEAGEMQPALPSDELAYIIVRITESFLYRDVITGVSADIEAAIAAIRILLTAEPDPSRPRKRSKLRH
ncbi:MAG TPA: QsdR family transcriptional regulator [Kofleriaceae bacterium]|nr:QsdR family transcriptional regulator [Kofleriaceae bacterium]